MAGKPLYVIFTQDCEQLMDDSIHGGPEEWSISERSVTGFADTLEELRPERDVLHRGADGRGAALALLGSGESAASSLACTFIRRIPASAIPIISAGIHVRRAGGHVRHGSGPVGGRHRQAADHLPRAATFPPTTIPIPRLSPPASPTAASRHRAVNTTKRRPCGKAPSLTHTTRTRRTASSPATSTSTKFRLRATRCGGARRTLPMELRIEGADGEAHRQTVRQAWADYGGISRRRAQDHHAVHTQHALLRRYQQREAAGARCHRG